MSSDIIFTHWGNFRSAANQPWSTPFRRENRVRRDCMGEAAKVVEEARAGGKGKGRLTGQMWERFGVVGHLEGALETLVW